MKPASNSNIKSGKTRVLESRTLDLDRDGTAETVRLYRNQADRLFLGIFDSGNKSLWNSPIQEARGPAEIEAIADINGDEKTEIVVKSPRGARYSFIEIFSYNQGNTRRVFSAGGLQSWRIQESGQEIMTVEHLGDTVNHGLRKIFTWQRSHYLLTDKELFYSKGKPAWPQTKEKTARAFLEAIDLGSFEEAKGYLSAEFGPEQVEKLAAVLVGGWESLVVDNHIPVDLPEGVTALGALYQVAGSNYMEGKIYLFEFSKEPSAQGTWKITGLKGYSPSPSHILSR